MNGLTKRPVMPIALFVQIVEENVQIFVEQGSSPRDLMQLQELANSVFAEQHYRIDKAATLPAASNMAVKQLMLQLTLAGETRTAAPRQAPDIDSLIELLRPLYRIPASLAVRSPEPQLGVHYRISTPHGYPINVRRLMEQVPRHRRPQGYDRQGSLLECYLTEAATHQQIREEAQRVAATSGAFIVGEISTYTVAPATLH